MRKINLIGVLLVVVATGLFAKTVTVRAFGIANKMNQKFSQDIAAARAREQIIKFFEGSAYHYVITDDGFSKTTEVSFSSSGIMPDTEIKEVISLPDGSTMVIMEATGEIDLPDNLVYKEVELTFKNNEIDSLEITLGKTQSRLLDEFVEENYPDAIELVGTAYFTKLDFEIKRKKITVTLGIQFAVEEVK